MLKQGCLSINSFTANMRSKRQYDSPAEPIRFVCTEADEHANVSAKICPLYDAKLQRDFPIAFATLSALSAALSAVSTSLP